MAIKLLLCDAPEGIALLEYALLRSQSDFEIEVGTDGYRAVELAARTRPHVIVAEVALPGLSGAELVRRLRAAHPETRVICWTSLAAPDGAAEMFRAGALGYLLKEDGAEEVARAIPHILSGGAVISPRVAIRLVGRFAESLHRERELNRALAEASMKVQDVTHAKAEFLANVSHELRTPVTVVKGIAFVLKDGRISDEEKVEFLDRLQGAVEKLTTLVDNVLTIADLDRGNLALQIAECDLASLVRHVCDEVAKKYPEVVVEKFLPESAPVLADPARIAEAVRQLIDNACRYSPEGASVVVRLRFMDEGITLSVTDTGEGLRREVVSMAFNEPFTAGEEILRKERAGIGLGLHLARQLILMHGGIMWADPLPGGGTRVSFCIPSDQGGSVSMPGTFPGAAQGLGQGFPADIPGMPQAVPAAQPPPMPQAYPAAEAPTAQPTFPAAPQPEGIPPAPPTAPEAIPPEPVGTVPPQPLGPVGPMPLGPVGPMPAEPLGPDTSPQPPRPDEPVVLDSPDQPGSVPTSANTPS
jgi:signal transduction histidine kinase